MALQTPRSPLCANSNGQEIVHLPDQPEIGGADTPRPKEQPKQRVTCWVGTKDGKPVYETIEA